MCSMRDLSCRSTGDPGYRHGLQARSIAARFHVFWHESATSYAKVMRIRASSQEGFEGSDFCGVNGETLPGEFLLERFGT